MKNNSSCIIYILSKILKSVIIQIIVCLNYAKLSNKEGLNQKQISNILIIYNILCKYK